ncbi:prepilin-type N-terminal cleavage/methylation domain-containing protein [Microbacterium oleivorans]|uniref:type IV pilus modification PilV family protein n=1 Tax=Microbacterium TaxID=33882 RepID=UPI00203CA43D|nr:prepilin-type N-terminal cleavage/methylation domain-containing protein [Microbacterium oleivorans]MCM3697667.1 prepilin-type N-terminal cleavage/methylation domain-containing protein [Microbacterium oleivorans]
MTGTRTPDSDEGFGLVEVVVAMLLFAVIAMAILPLAVQATTLSAGNRDRVAANAFASSELAAMRARFPDEAANSCAAVRAAATTTVDPADTGLVARSSAASCPTAYPAALTVTVDVRDPAASDPAAALVTMATKIVVTAP